MNTLLLTSQIVCYGVGIVSASLNIATFVRRRRIRLRRVQGGRSGLQVLVGPYKLLAGSSSERSISVIPRSSGIPAGPVSGFQKFDSLSPSQELIRADRAPALLTQAQAAGLLP